MHACPLAFQDDVRFADMAPQSSMLVIAADDLAGMISKFEKSPLHGICEVDAVKEMMADTFGNAAEAMAGKHSFQHLLRWAAAARGEDEKGGDD